MLVTELMRSVSFKEEWYPLLEKYLENLKSDDYQCLYDSVYVSIYGEVLSEEKAKRLVSAMQPYGEHWTIEEANDALSGDYKQATKYYVMNMMYNDYHDMFDEDSNRYIEISKLWLKDIDAPDGDIKTYRYATRV